jgi:hypothetical protein
MLRSTFRFGFAGAPNTLNLEQNLLTGAIGILFYSCRD